MAEIAVEVVYALPESQTLLTVTLPEEASVADAVERSGILARHPEIDWPRVSLGIFGRKVTAATRLRPGDRVEIYRPLRVDPKERRRRRAGRA